MYALSFNDHFTRKNVIKSQGGKFAFYTKVNLPFKHQISFSGVRFTFSNKKITPSDVLMSLSLTLVLCIQSQLPLFDSSRSFKKKLLTEDN